MWVHHFCVPGGASRLKVGRKFRRVYEQNADVTLASGECIQVTVLSEALSEKAMSILANGECDHDEYHINGQEIYFLFRDRISDSKLAKSLQKLGKTATTRNWNTMNKLAGLEAAMQESIQN